MLTPDQIRSLAELGAAATIRTLEQQLAELRAEFPGAARARVELPDGQAPPAPAKRSHQKKQRSPETRAKMARAQKARWRRLKNGHPKKAD